MKRGRVDTTDEEAIDLSGLEGLDYIHNANLIMCSSLSETERTLCKGHFCQQEYSMTNYAVLTTRWTARIVTLMP